MVTDTVLFYRLRRLFRYARYDEHPKKRRERIARYWEKSERPKSPYPDVKEIFKELGELKDRPMLFLGPYREGLVRSVEESGTFSKSRYLDAIRSYLRNPLDPYRLNGLRPGTENADYHDEFTRGTWHLYVKDNPVVVAFEFSPFLPLYEALAGLMKVASVSDTLVHMRYGNYPSAFGVVEELARRLGLEIREKTSEQSGIKVSVIRFDEDFRKLAKVFTRVFHTTPIKEWDENKAVKLFLEEMQRSFRDKKKLEELKRRLARALEPLF